MASKPKSYEQLLTENRRLRARLARAERKLRSPGTGPLPSASGAEVARDRALAQQKELLAGIIDHIPVMIAVFDPELQSFRFNRYLREILGWTEQDAVDGDFMSKVYPDPAYCQEVSRFMQTLEPGWRDFVITAKDGSTIETSWSNIKLSDHTLIGIGIDVRERKAVEREKEAAREAILSGQSSLADAMRKSEQRTRNIMDNLLNFVGVLTPQGILLEANRAPLEMAGLSIEDVRGKRFEDCWWWSYSVEVQAQLREAIDRAARGETLRYDVDVRGAGGRMISLDFAIAPLLGENGQVEFLIPSAVEITDRKRAEEALRESEQRLWAALRNSGLLIYNCDLDLRYTWAVNPHPDWPLQTILGKRDDEIMPPAQAAQLISFKQRALECGQGQRAEICLPTSQGRTYWDATAEPLRDEKDQIVGLTIAALDITHLKNIQEQVRESESLTRRHLAELQNIYNSAPIGLCVLDRNLRFIRVNEHLAEINGLPADDHIGRTVCEILPDMGDEVECALRRVLKTRMPVLDLEISGKTRAQLGVVRHWLASYLPIIDDRLEVVGINMTCLEITDRKRLEHDRTALLDAERAARSEAERLNRLKDEFLATVSHELRTPLNAIVGWSRMLARGKAEDLPRAINILERNASSLTQIVEDLLDMSRIISGRIMLERQRVHLQPLVTAVAEGLRLAADAKEIKVEIWFDPELDWIHGDPNRIQQVVWNLLTNAVKFTPAGGQVHVRVARSQSSIDLSVQDNGQGIAPEFLPNLFGRFQQADSSITRKHGGLGLGLSIVKNLVELHGGTVRGESEGLGRGATFTVSFPLPAHAQEHTQELSEAGASDATFDPGLLDGVRVVLIDDDPDAGELSRRLLKDCGADVHVAESAAHGFRMIMELEPQLVISDIGMPEEDGYTLARRIRAGGDWCNQLVMIALTALARPEDRERAIQAGFDEHLPKPIEPGKLIGVLGGLMARMRSPAEASSAPPASGTDRPPDRTTQGAQKDKPPECAKKRSHILLVEDNEAIAEMLKSLLEEAELHVSVCGGVADAFEVVQSKPVDLIISDVRLRDGTGWDLMKKVRAMDNPTAGIAMSGYSDNSYVQMSKAAGFLEHLVKPMDEQELISTIQRILASQQPPEA